MNTTFAGHIERIGFHFVCRWRRVVWFWPQGFHLLFDRGHDILDGRLLFVCSRRALRLWRGFLPGGTRFYRASTAHAGAGRGTRALRSAAGTTAQARFARDGRFLRFGDFEARSLGDGPHLAVSADDQHVLTHFTRAGMQQSPAHVTAELGLRWNHQYDMARLALCQSLSNPSQLI